jgi:hypothetical protein
MIMKFYLVLLSFSLISCKVTGQTQKIGCEKFQELIRSPIFDNQFQVTRDLDIPLIVIDTTNVILGCETEQKVGKRPVMLINDFQKNHHNMKNVIVISSGQQECVFTINFFMPSTGNYLSYSYLVNNDNLKLIGYRIGDY